MFSKDHLDFRFPLFTTCMHMIVQFLLASAVLYFIPRFRPRHDSISNSHDQSHIRREMIDTKKPLMTRMFYATRIGPCGAATGLDIGLGNTSLKFISLTFFSMSKCFSYLDLRLIGIASHVQIFLSCLRSPFRIPFSSRNTLSQIDFDYYNNDCRSHHDGSRRDRFQHPWVYSNHLIRFLLRISLGPYTDSTFT